MFGVGPIELIVLAAAAIMLFGGDLPDVLRRAGRAIGRLRTTAADLAHQINADDIEPPGPPPPSATGTLPPPAAN